ncbi:DUF6282 family protein [Undibacter mobilis]|uniref:Amidohydrolase-related domain-containing protein n=1 Tax=Undibacter mobilis TaxID=2292256 RepID=A0A371BAE6_9BRAD|nr:DUF6282 family protein [Undibacter mobilis]RDV04534.1 hypothetical protein DXH78_08130 [Undibacter mobilis]
MQVGVEASSESGRGSLADALLVGAYDIHRHGYPEMSLDCRTRYSDVDNLISSRDAGFKAVVLKSHFWPTVGRAYHLRNLVPGIDIIPSITLNRVVGGFDPIAVESAALQGARVMWFPTWSAANDIERGGISRQIMPAYLKRTKDLPSDYGLRVTDAGGKVGSDVRECLAVAAEHDMLVCTGHISAQESIALAGAIKDAGIERFVFTHPDSGTVGATLEQIDEMVSLGAVCEVCAIGFMPLYMRMRIAEFVALIERLGSAKIVLTSDYFFDWFPPASEAVRLVVGTLLQCNVSIDAIKDMICRNPARLIGATGS